MNSIHFFLLAGVIAMLIPLVPRMLRLRITVLKFLHLTWLAGWHQRHFRILVPAARWILALLAGYLIYLGLTVG